MKISSKGRYAVAVMVDIAMANKEFVSIAEISSRQNITVKYLEQIISKLVKANLLTSCRGIAGGYKLNKPPKDYTIAEILYATGDMPKIVPCRMEGAVCPEKDKCHTIGVWEGLSAIIYDYLNKVSLQDLIDKTL